jgi:WD40 repeat protein
LQAELVGSVADLQATRARNAAEGSQSLPVCPYKGLAAFGGDDAGYFFGRERWVAELVARLVGSSLLAVVGPSGVGKSSVVRAGLLPALAGGVLPGSQSWVQAVIRPGARPLAELRRAQRRLEREWRGMLVVDQLEELFTAGAAEAERRAFADALVRAARERRAGGVVLVVRADFYGRCSAYPELAGLMGANHVLVAPMSREELGRAIERPAERAGLSVEAGLVEALVDDVVEQPGALPLLSTTLLELWRERDGRHLRLAAYVRSGGVEGAVARLAEDAYRQLDAERQTAARRLLLRLADEDAGGLLVRRRIPLADADADLVATLADQRLLTVDDGTVEVAHEALLREWPRLRGWLDEDAQGRRLRRRVATAAQAWQAGEGELYRGARLATALEWAAGHGTELSSVEQAFLEAGRRAATRAQRRLRTGMAGVMALALLAVLGGGLALRQRADARAQATAAAAQSLGSAALAEGDVAKALLLARQGVALHDSPQTRGNLLATLLKAPDAVGVLPRAGSSATGLALSPDGRTLVITDSDGDVRFLSTATRREIAQRRLSSLPVEADTDGLVRFSDDGRRLVVGGLEPVIIDTRTRRVLAPLVLPDGGGMPAQFAFAPDGRELLAVVNGFGLPRPALVRFDTRTGHQLGTPKSIGRAAVLLTSDGRVVTSREGGPTSIRDGRTLRPLRSFAAGAAHAALSPDGHTVLLGSADGSVRFLDLRDGRVRTASGRHDGAVTSAAFSADGLLAATGGGDERVIVWDVARAASRETLSGHTAAITGVAFSHDGQTLYSAGLDGDTLVWDLGGTRRLDRRFTVGDAPGLRPPFAVSVGGGLLAVGDKDGTVAVIDASTLQPVRTFRAVPSGPVLSLAFVPHGGPLAVGGQRGFLALVDARRGTRLQRLGDESGDQAEITTSADGTRLATLSRQGEVTLWRFQDGRAVGPPRRSGSTAIYFPDDIRLSPDGRTIAILPSTPNAGVEMVDAHTLQPREPLHGSRGVIAFTYTPDGRYIVGGGGAGGWARLWSTRTLRPVSGTMPGHIGGRVLWTSVSPDGRLLATGSTSGTIRLYDLPSQRPLGAPLPAVPNHPVIPLFSPNGAYLYAITDTPRAYRWDVRPAAWEARACAVAGRTLSRAEWADALPGRPYAPACAG